VAITWYGQTNRKTKKEGKKEKRDRKGERGRKAERERELLVPPSATTKLRVGSTDLPVWNLDMVVNIPKKARTGS
jgi:hypothetical protein